MPNVLYNNFMSDEQNPASPPGEPPSLEQRFKEQFEALARALEAERYFHRQTQEEFLQFKEAVEKEHKPLVRLVNAADNVSRNTFADRYGFLNCRHAEALQALRDALDEVPPGYAGESDEA
jgi:hypothetical protein